MLKIPYSQIPSPCYLLDEDLLRKNLALIQDVQNKAGIEIIMALKGFAMWSVFPIAGQYINGATASSLNEAMLIKEHFGFKAHTYAPAYTDSEIDTIAKLSSHLTFNSLNQYQKYYPTLKNKGISFGLRVNPEYSEVGTDLYNPCSPGSRLGILSDQLAKLPEGIEGLHFHTLCESGAEALEKTLNAFERKFSHLLSLPQLKWVNMGGGHLMTRNGYNIQLLIDLLHRFKKRYHLHIILEPGSAFAWETGVLISDIEDIVENKGIKTAILNVSFTAHMPDCLEMPYQPRIAGAASNADGPFVYRMGGNSCLAGDFMGYWSFDHELKPGEKIIFQDMIHYTMVKTSHFNGLRHPSIGIWSEKEGFRLVKQFSYDDYKRQLS